MSKTDKNKIRELDESLPYVERFRPQKLDDIMSHDSVKSTLKSYLVSRRIPHLLFYGPPGTGKTSTIESFLHELYGDVYYSYMVMNINASEERGIDVVRGKIKNFVNSKPIESTENIPIFKFVILDEADAITVEAQGMLRNVIEKNTKFARFCLICNCIKKIDPAIQSRCKNFKFSPLNNVFVNQKINSICAINKIEISESGKNMIWKLSKGDMRKALQTLQVISTTHSKINEDIVSDFFKYPSQDSVNRIYNSLLNDALVDAVQVLRTEKSMNYYSLKDIIVELSERIAKDTIDTAITTSQSIYIDKKLRDIEMNMITASESDQQLTAIVASFIVMRRK